MRGFLGLVGLVIVLAIGYLVYRSQFTRGDEVVAPRQRIDTVGVKSDLLAIAQAERLYLARHGAYASLELLEQQGAILFSPKNRRGYEYVAEVDGGRHFTVTAVPQNRAWPTFSIDETMQVVQK